MPKQAYRQPGSEVALRGLFRGRVWHIVAATVVSDEADSTIVLQLPGCERYIAAVTNGAETRVVTNEQRWKVALGGEWSMLRTPWTKCRVLHFLEPDQFYSISMFWDAQSGRLRDYYLNFQMPVERSAVGFDTLDLDLDIVVRPDFSWSWKDVDDWERAIDSGALSDFQIQGVETVKAEAVDRIERDRLSHLDEWLTWTPPDNWPPAELPDGWAS